MIRPPTVAALLLGLGLAHAAAAASKDVERLQVQIAGLEGQVADLRRLADDNLKELRRLNEQLAEQNALFKKSLADQRLQGEALQTTLKDLSDRLAELRERYQAMGTVPAFAGSPAETGATGSTGGGSANPSVTPMAGATPAPPLQPPAPRELYSQAYADYARGNFDLAIQEYQEYIKNYPKTDFSARAQYWIGECHYGKQRYNEAVEAWNTLFREYPTSDKVPDARVKKGKALERLGRRSQALVEYRYVVDRYPNSPAARIARESLNPQ